jgi:eukaryotic-like serine/threonine-protein kinase
MLTKAGEVKVLDFGLARWLQRGRKSSDKISAAKLAVRPAEGTAIAETMVLNHPEAAYGSTPAGRREFHATAVGITLGTPLYMSPEQARGESLTPASDMFSFGLLLQRLFTGMEPHPEDLMAREVILRVARGTTNPVEGAPRDVTALINRLKQFAPADRPTAVEAVERLQFLEETPQRIARRSVVALLAFIAAFGAWRYTVDLKAERAIAVEARADADRRRAQAEDLIEFMLGDLRKKLEPAGSLDALDAAGERVLKYVGSSRPETMSAEELARTSKALNQLGEVRIAQGRLGEALTVFQRSLGFAQQAVKREPGSGTAQLAVATAHFWVGDVARQQNDLPQSLRHYTAYMETAEALAKREPANDTYRLERAYGHSSVAAVYERQGDFARALQHLHLTREIKAARVREAPNDLDRQADLANTFNRIGLIQERSGDLRGARAHYEQELATYLRLVAREPRNTRWKSWLSRSRHYLGWVLEMSGDVTGALEQRRGELALSQELQRQDPENTRWRRNLAIAEMNHGNALRLTGDPRAAVAAVSSGARTLQPLLSRAETLWSWRQDMGAVQTSLALAHLGAGDIREAKRTAMVAVSILESLGQKGAVSHRAAAYLALGDIHAAEGDLSRARGAWSSSVTLLASLDRNEQTPQVLDTLARALLHLGRTNEAAPIVERLTRTGYRAPDFVSAISQRT